MMDAYLDKKLILRHHDGRIASPRCVSCNTKHPDFSGYVLDGYIEAGEEWDWECDSCEDWQHSGMYDDFARAGLA